MTGWRSWFALALLCSVSTHACADAYTKVISEATQQHPAYTTFLAVKSSAESLANIESAKRYPKVDGVASRVDGRSNLVTSSSAWQAGLSSSYPLFDNGRQNASDRMSRGQAQLEIGTALIPLEQASIDLSAAYLRAWEAQQSVKELDKALAIGANFITAIQPQLDANEVSQISYSRILTRTLGFKAKRIEAAQRYQSANALWRSVGLDMPSVWALPSLKEWEGSVLPNGKLIKIRGEFEKVDAELEYAKKDEGLSIDLQASVLSRKFTEGGTPWTPYRTWQISGNYPFYDGGLRSAKTARQVQLKAAKEAEEKAELQLAEMDGKRLKDEVKSAMELVKEMVQQCTLQAKLGEQITERFSLGRGEAQDVIESHFALAECQLTLVRTQLDAYLKYNDWMRVSGKWASKFIGEDE
jgi:outer membrane protein TolC